MLVRSNMQNPDTAGVVHNGQDDLDKNDGDQSIMFRLASDEHGDTTRLTHTMDTRLYAKLPDVRKNRISDGCIPTARQVTTDYMRAIRKTRNGQGTMHSGTHGQLCVQKESWLSDHCQGLQTAKKATRRPHTCSGLMGSSSPGKSALCSVQFHRARPHVEGCPEQEVARHAGPDEDTAPNMEDMTR